MMELISDILITLYVVPGKEDEMMELIKGVEKAL